MAWTKKQLIDEAFAEIGLRGYEFDLQPEEKHTGLKRLDSMVAAWERDGISIGYVLPASPDESDIDADSGIEDADAEAVYASLAVRLAPTFGKVPTPETKTAAADGYARLVRIAAMPAQQRLRGGFPSGAGNRSVSGGYTTVFTETEAEDPLEGFS